MRKQELDNWVKTGGDLPENLTDNEEAYLTSLGHDYVPVESEEGVLVEEYHYLNGKEHGRYTSRYEDGRIRTEEFWFKGKQHGFETKYDHCDNILRKKEYAYGVLLKEWNYEES